MDCTQHIAQKQNVIYAALLKPSAVQSANVHANTMQKLKTAGISSRTVSAKFRFPSRVRSSQRFTSD